MPDIPAYTKRKGMSDARKKRVLDRFGWKCPCGAPLTIKGGGMVVDHDLPLWLGGAEEDQNLVPLCGPCNKAKTASDAAIRAKVKRLWQKAPGAPRKPSLMRSKPFRKDLRKRMDGRVEKR